MLSLFEETLGKKVAEWEEPELFAITSDDELTAKINSIENLREFVDAVDSLNPDFAGKFLRPALIVMNAERIERELDEILNEVEVEEDLPKIIEPAISIADRADDPFSFFVAFLTLLNYCADDKKVSSYGEKFVKAAKEVFDLCLPEINQHNFLLASGGVEYIERIDQIYCDRFGEVLLSDERERMSGLQAEVNSVLQAMARAQMEAFEQMKEE